MSGTEIEASIAQECKRKWYSSKTIENYSYRIKKSIAPKKVASNTIKRRECEKKR